MTSGPMPSPAMVAMRSLRLISQAGR
jgi:hypothetical protein